MRAWILANIKKIQMAITILSTVIGVWYFYYQHTTIKELKGEVANLQEKNNALQANLDFKNSQVDILSQNCEKKEILNSQINEVKTEILKTNKATTDKNTVDESLKKAGEFILQRAK
ncbi:MAG: hypothetical protein IJT33_06605 [Campylobacter sp.]|nr:hypothetical protein [Campylobacter sp.]MBQ7676109.1 hypothetical protein [Campylobacter sp.]MBQ9876734.1 hypothetical protein [Campylobacter sp.]